MSPLYFQNNNSVSINYSPKSISYLSLLPQEIQNLIAIYCYINECSEQTEDLMSLWCGGLYGKKQSHYGIFSSQPCIWQDRDYGKTTSSYDLYKTTYPYIVTTSLKVKHNAAQTLFVITNAGVKYLLKQIGNDTLIECATVSGDGRLLFTIEQKLKNLQKTYFLTTYKANINKMFADQNQLELSSNNYNRLLYIKSCDACLLKQENTYTLQAFHLRAKHNGLT